MGTFTLHADFDALDGGETRTKKVHIQSNTQVLGPSGVIFDSATVDLVDGVLNVELPADDNPPGEFGYIITRTLGMTRRWQVPVQPADTTVELSDYTSTTALPLTPDEYAQAQQALDAEIARATAAENLKLAKASNLSDLANAATARDNLGLGNVDDTSDADKPVSTAQQAALDEKVPTTRTLAGLDLSANRSAEEIVTALAPDLSASYVPKSPSITAGTSTVIREVGDAGRATSKWREVYDGTTFNSVYDPVMFWGWNAGVPAGIGDAADHSWHMGFEAKYQDAPTTSMVEWYLQYRNAGDTAGLRPLTVNARINAASGAVVADVGTSGAGGYFQVKDDTGWIAHYDSASIFLSRTVKVGDGLASSQLAFRATGTNVLTFQRGGTDRWYLYDGGGNTTLYLRDMTNAKMQVSYVAGSGTGGGSTTFDSALIGTGTLSIDGASTLKGGLQVGTTASHVEARLAGSYTVPNGAFTKIPLDTEDYDPGSNFDTSTGIYTVPTTGTYLLLGMARAADAATSGTNWAVGINTATADFEEITWGNISTSTGSRRLVIVHERLARLAAGDQLRMVGYIDGTTLQLIKARMKVIRIA